MKQARNDLNTTLENGNFLNTFIGATGKAVKLGFIALFVAMAASIGTAFSAVFANVGYASCFAFTTMPKYVTWGVDVLTGPLAYFGGFHTPDDTSFNAAKDVFGAIGKHADKWPAMVGTVMNTVYTTLSSSKMLGGMILTLASYTIADVQMGKHQNTVDLSKYQNELKKYGEALEDPKVRDKMVREGEHAAKEITMHRTSRTGDIVKDINTTATQFRDTSDRALAELDKCNGQPERPRRSKQKSNHLRGDSEADSVNFENDFEK